MLFEEGRNEQRQRKKRRIRIQAKHVTKRYQLEFIMWDGELTRAMGNSDGGQNSH